MAEMIIAPDPIVVTRAFLARHFPRVTVQVPRGWDWSDRLMVVRDAGGAGEYSRVLTDARITVDCSAPSIGQASADARRALALLRLWADTTEGVYWRSTVARPAYWPDDDTGTPLYTFAVNLAFRAEAVDAEDILN